jgi:acyl carrier protein
MPLTPNGKVDRKALPAPGTLSHSPGGPCVLPRNEMERAIAEIWQDALHLEKVGIEDSFFDLGGHSLLLVQVQNKLNKILDKPLPMMDLFRYPTIGSLAEYLSQKETAKAPVVEGQALAQKAREGKARLRERLRARRPRKALTPQEEQASL